MLAKIEKFSISKFLDFLIFFIAFSSQRQMSLRVAAWSHKTGKSKECGMTNKHQKIFQGIYWSEFGIKQIMKHCANPRLSMLRKDVKYLF